MRVIGDAEGLTRVHRLSDTTKGTSNPAVRTPIAPRVYAIRESSAGVRNSGPRCMPTRLSTQRSHDKSDNTKGIAAAFTMHESAQVWFDVLRPSARLQEASSCSRKAPARHSTLCRGRQTPSSQKSRTPKPSIRTKKRKRKEQENDLEIQLALFHRDYGLVLGMDWVSNVKIVLIWCTAFFGHEEATFKTLHYHPKSSTQPSQRASIGTPPSLEVIV